MSFARIRKDSIEGTLKDGGRRGEQLQSCKSNESERQSTTGHRIGGGQAQR